MKKKIDTVIFDFDGVLVDTGPDIANAANFTLRLLKLEELPQNTVIDYIGGGAEMLMRRCLKEHADSLLNQALEIFNQRYNENCCVESYLYGGVKAVLEILRINAKHMAIATQKKEAATQSIMDHLGISPYFDLVIGPDSVAHRKPHPESVLRILEKTATLPERAVMVGDMPSDIQTGKAAHTLTCGVFYGYGSKSAILAEKPDFSVEHLPQILDWIE